MPGIRLVAILSGFLLLYSTALADYSYEYYEGDWSVLPDFDALTPVTTGTVPDFDISVRSRDSRYGFRFTGSIEVAVDDTYTFYTTSDDGSQLFINGNMVVDNDGLHGPTQRSGAIFLSAGSHAITVTFFEQGGGEVLDVTWSNSSNGQQPIPPDGTIGTPPDVSAEGRWGPVIPWPHVAVSAANLPDGRVLTWSGSERATWPSTEQTYSGTWDPESGEFVEIFHDGHNMFCAHLAMAEDGRVFVNGGRNQQNSPWTSLFDYRDNSWVQIENMASGGRWYPTTVALTDGDMFTAIGTATNQRYPDRWDPDEGWRIQPGIDFNSMVLNDYFSTGTHGESRWWPLLHVAPNGKLFHSGPTPQMHWINPAGSGSFEPVGATFTDFYHKHGTTVMYDEGKLLTAGGWVNGNSITSTNQAFTVDLNGPTPVVQSTSPMHYPRKFQNGVILPDGTVLVVGGNTSGRKFSDDGSVLAPEVWDPATGEWTLLAPMTIPRNYHSVALLLTDGRVLAAGSGYNSNNVPASTHQDGQVFYPPYLFNEDGSLAQRPAITDAAGVVETGSTFNVSTTESIAYFSLIKMSSTTHGVNTDVRYLRPQFVEAGANGYDVTLNPNPNVATPGYWMLFAINHAGVPSEAHVVRITAVDTRFENRALTGVARQSSTATGNVDLSAANAADGDLSGDEASGSLASTAVESNAWWEVDLGQNHDVDTIRLWNRTDCCTDGLADFHVFVSVEPFSSNEPLTTQAQPGVTDFFHAGESGRQFDLDVSAQGRYVRIQRSTAGALHIAEVQVFARPAPVAPPPPVEIRAENGTLNNVGSSWQTVELAHTYEDPVIVATPRYTGSQLPAVTRIRNAAGNRFDIRVQNPSDIPLSGYAVDFVAVEAGTYDTDSFKLEAGKVDSTVTDHSGSWVGEARVYQQAYSNPVVLGQVMTHNDPRWSVFWASNGVQTNPPDASALSVGKHVAEDNDRARNTETIGYIVVEAGMHSAAGFSLTAGVGADNVMGLVQAAPYVYDLSIPFDLAVVSSAAMDGGNGGWPVNVDTPLPDGQLGLGIDEDQIRDAERDRTTDQVAYLAMTRSVNGLQVSHPATQPGASGTALSYSVEAFGPGPLQYSWNFGEGDTPFSPENTATHVFDTPGRHIVTVTVLDGEGNEQTLTFTQLVHLPLTAGSPVASTGILDFSARGEIWNINPDNDTVSVIDPLMQAVVATIPVPDDPRSLAIAPDGRVWVTSKGASVISIIDPSIGYAVQQMLFLDIGAQPHGIVIGQTSAYIALEATGQVIGLDAITGDEFARSFVGARPRHLSLDATGSVLYASLFVTPPLPGESTGTVVVDDGTAIYGGTIKVLDAGTLGETGQVILRHSDRLVSEHSGPGVPNYLGPAVVSPDGSTAWVPSKQDNVLAGALRGGQGMTFDQTVRAISSKIDLATLAEDFVMRVDHDNASVASNAAFGPFGVHLFTALEGNREIAVSDVFSGVEIMRFDVGRAPQGIAVSADGTRLYVHNFMDRTIGIYDISSLVQSGAIEAVELGTVRTVTNEALAADVFLGKQLFYDSRDDRLAALDYMSCASCHSDGTDDGRVWDFTGIGEGLRNTTSLEGRSGMAHGFLHWSANFDEVQDFELQIRTFAGGTGLMDNADFYTGTRAEPLGDPKAGISSDLDALAAYVSSLAVIPASPYRPIDGGLSPDAQAGAELFESRGCVGCHTLTNLTDSSDGGGLHDIGTLSAASGNRLGGPLAGIDTPTLLGAWATPPYLHDGSAATLQDAIVAHDGVVLTGAELDDLAALIRELDHGAELASGNGMKLATGVVANVASEWQTVTLPQPYTDMVVIASVQYDRTALPAVARVRHADGNRFELRVQNPGNIPLSGYSVHYVVLEAGVYTAAEHGVRMEAVKFTSTVTDSSSSWRGESRSYAQAYANPIVVGQVMTANDAAWSVFWASNGTRENRPSPTSLSVGKHVGEDPNRARTTETIGYVVIEAGEGVADGHEFSAGVTADSIEGILQAAPYVTSVGGAFTSGAVSSVGMDGNNGGWPVLYGSDPLGNGQLDLGIDEDQLNDTERTHITEEVAFFLLR